MDSVERDQRQKENLSDRGKKLYKRKVKDDHKKDKQKKENLRENVKGITK